MDSQYMRIALDLSIQGKGLTSPNPMVGAVIVKNGLIIGQGYHKKYGENHAEINAFESAVESVEDATMYVTLEPCSHYGKTPPCADKIIAKKIKKVVVAMLDPNPLVAGKGVAKLKAAGIEVVVGVMAEEAEIVNEVFLKYIVNKEPFVHLKAAMSLDGKIATASGESRWISGEESRMQVHRLRGQYSGIMVGVQTVINDNPELTCRIDDGNNPTRIIVDTNLRIPLDSKVLMDQENAKTILATTQNADDKKLQEIRNRGIQIVQLPIHKNHVHLRMLMKELGKIQIDSILLEGGGTLNYSALEEKIVDKLSLYIAPIIIGGDVSPTPISGAGIAQLSDAFRLKKLKVELVGQDLKVEGYIDK